MERRYAGYQQQFTMYLTLGIVNTIEVFAVNEAGNRSAPATMMALSSS